MWLLRRLSISIVLVGLLAACDTPPPGPGIVAGNYVTDIAQGDFVSACASLDAGARDSLSTDMRSRSPCRTLLAQCFPTQANQINKDQLQLYYSNVNVIENGSRAEVQTSGTAVANRIKLVTLAQKSGVWQLTSYGKEKCRQAGRRR